MASEWGGALFAAGAVASTMGGVYALWKGGSAATRQRRKVAHERVALSATLGRQKTEQMLSFLAAAGAGLALVIVTNAFTGRIGLSIAVGLGGLMVPTWVREWRDTRRIIQLSEQLGRVMSMIGTSLRRGTPLEGAIAEAAASLSEPLGPALRGLADSTSMGVTLSQSIEQIRNLPSVKGSPDFQVFATEMVVCHERGANVVKAFEALGQVLDSRRRYRDQVRENMGQHLVQSLVITAVGFFVLGAYAFLTEDGLGPLLESFVGQALLAVAILGNMFLLRLTHLSMLRQTRKV